MGHGPLKNEKVAEVVRNEEHGTDKLEITRVHEIRTLKKRKSNRWSAVAAHPHTSSRMTYTTTCPHLPPAYRPPYREYTMDWQVVNNDTFDRNTKQMVEMK